MDSANIMVLFCLFNENGIFLNKKTKISYPIVLIIKNLNCEVRCNSSAARLGIHRHVIEDVLS